MKSIQNFAAGFFITAVVILSFVSVLGVWKIFDADVITKSFETLGLLGLVAIIIMVAGKFIGNGEEQAMPTPPNPAFKIVRSVTVVVLIVCGVFLALLGVLAIWKVINNTDVLFKSLGSLAIIVFSSFVIIMTCLDREQNPLLHGGSAGSRRMSGVSIVIVVILAITLLPYLSRMLFYGW